MTETQKQDMNTNINRIFLAPMDGYTDSALRETMAINAIVRPSMLFTEFVNVEALTRDIPNTQRILHFTENQRPVVAQLFGKNPDAFYRATLKVIDKGFDGVDINMGCPAKKIATKTEGAGLINNPDLADKIIQSCQKAIDDSKTRQKKTFTFSVKTRIGFNQDDAINWISHLDQFNFDFITLHGRTFKQMYTGKADWEKIGDVAKVIKTPLVGNGDIVSIQEAYDKQKQYGLYATMIGRNGQILLGDDPKNRIKATIDYLTFHQQKQATFFKREELAFNFTKKIVLWLLKGVENTSDLKANIMHAVSYEEAQEFLQKFVV